MERHCHAWDAYNAGRLAVRLDEVEFARSLFERADRRGPTRGKPIVRDQLDSLPPVAEGSPDPTAATGQPTGKIVYIHPKRHFGFLVDQSGVKRHFRTRNDEGLRKGRKVIFAPTEQEKGPAAEDVRIAS